MVKLLNIKKNDNIIECDIMPEDSSKKGHLVVDISSEDILEYTLPADYEWCINHVHHAKRFLLRLKTSNDIPDERLIMWY